MSAQKTRLIEDVTRDLDMRPVLRKPEHRKERSRLTQADRVASQVAELEALAGLIERGNSNAITEAKRLGFHGSAEVPKIRAAAARLRQQIPVPDMADAMRRLKAQPQATRAK